MKAYQRFFLPILAFSVAWMGMAGICFGLATGKDRWNHLVLVMPLYALVLYGCYALASIGLRLLTFNDCSEATSSLEKEIAEARKDLQKRGWKHTF